MPKVKSLGSEAMNNNEQEILGYSLVTIGTITSAIGSTPIFFTKELRHHLQVWGNVLQATGNGLAADGQGTISFELIGDEIQSFGNIACIAGLLYETSNDTNKRLIITGNWMQAAGSLVGVVDEFEDNTPSGRALNIDGGLLQAIGNSMQALSDSYELKKVPDYEHLGITGSWIQAVGSVVSLIGQIKEEIQEIQLGINE